MARVRKGLLSDSVFNKKLMQLALPIALQNLMLASVAAADAIMLGNIEQNVMAAVSLATQIQFIQNWLISAIVSTITLLAAQYWGKGDMESMDAVFCIGLRISVLTSLVFFLGCELIPDKLMVLFTNEQVLIDLAVPYLKIAGWSYLLTGISQCYLCMLKVTEHASMAAIISTVTVLLNIVLNAIFIYGLLGAPRLEARGAALATLIARMVELVWSVGISLIPGFHHSKAKHLVTHNKLLFADFMKYMLPLVGASAMWGVGFTAYTAFVGHLGTDPAAANSVAAVVRDLVCCLCNGLAYGGGIMVGNSLGSGDLVEGKAYGIKLMKLGFIAGFASTAIMLALTPLLMLFVKLTEGASYYLVGMMIIMAFYMIGRTVNTVIINGIFAAGGDTLFDTYSLAVCMWGIAVPLAALGTFVFHWSPLLVYAMTCLDEVGKIPWVMIHFRKYKWVKNLTRENTV